MNKKLLIALAVCFIVMFVGGNSSAVKSQFPEQKKGDIEVSAGVTGLLPAVAVGWYLNNNVEFEAKAIIDPWG